MLSRVAPDLLGEVRQRTLRTARDIVRDHLGARRARIFLFGSSANGPVYRHSDIDIAIDPIDPVPPSLWASLAEALEESAIPYYVDLVDTSRITPDFRMSIERNGVEWTEPRPD